VLKRVRFGKLEKGWWERQGIWCYPLSRIRFVPGDFVGGGRDGAQTNLIRDSG